MTDPAALQRLLDLAQRTGCIYVAQDVYDALKPRLDARGMLPGGLRVVVGKQLQPGVMVAADMRAFRGSLEMNW